MEGMMRPYALISNETSVRVGVKDVKPEEFGQIASALADVASSNNQNVGHEDVGDVTWFHYLAASDSIQGAHHQLTMALQVAGIANDRTVLPSY